MTTSTNWASFSEDIVMKNLLEQRNNDDEKLREKLKKTKNYITNTFNTMNVDFEPDKSYRENVKFIIIGLVLIQILKQKTISLYRKGKEDREYLASYLMMKIQTHLINNYPTIEWDIIIKDICEHYKNNLRIDSEIAKTFRHGNK